MTVLGIDTSCDDTSVACIRDKEILSNCIFSQLFHSKYGGVLPELAARSHIQNIATLAKDALNQIGFDNVDGIGVTHGPGLIGSLIVGLSFAKAISYALDIPFYCVNHIEGHIFSLFIKNEIQFPFIAFIISGGHTELILVRNKGDYKVMGTTLDDAAGESFDKVARMLNLAYPGGEQIEMLAKKGNPHAIKFPRTKPKDYDFSFSGLKTAVLYFLKNIGAYKYSKTSPTNIEDICASFQEAAIDSLIYKAVKLSRELGISRIGIAGGVARNGRLRKKFREVNGLDTYFPEPEFCMDNGVMIALCAQYHLMKGEKSPFTTKVNSQANL